MRTCKVAECLWWFAAAMTLFALTAATCHAGIADAIDATCRVTAGDGSRGTGTVFEVSKGNVWILTAGHVVTSPQVQCEFWSQGHQSLPLPAVVVYRKGEPVDAAVIRLDEGSFGGRLPAAIPFAPRGTALAAGTAIVSSGCANGSWQSAWQGHVLGYEGAVLKFVPPPANGRSGSAILTADGRQIVGILTARGEGYGVATPIDLVYAAFEGKVAAKPNAAGPLAPVQCGPGGCPGGTCPGVGGGIGSQIQRPGYLLPYRNREAERQQTPGPWPTMPAPTPSANVDLGPVIQRLDDIARGQDHILQAVQQQPPAPPSATAPPTPPTAATPSVDDEARKGIAAAMGAIEKLGGIATDAKNTVSQVQKDVSDVRDLAKSATSGVAAVAEAVKEGGTLHQKFALLVEQEKATLTQQLGKPATEHEARLAILENLVKAGPIKGAAEVGSFLGPAGLLGAGVLGIALIGLVVFVVKDVKNHETTGSPLLIQKAFQDAQALRDSVLHGHLLSTLHDKINDVKAKVEAQSAAATPSASAPANTAAPDNTAAAKPA